jgi:hypothetical protein
MPIATRTRHALFEAGESAIHAKLIIGTPRVDDNGAAWANACAYEETGEKHCTLHSSSKLNFVIALQ